MSEAPKILPKQTVMMNSGKELVRMIFDTNGTDWGYQTGRIWQNGVKVSVYRDKQETLIWHEDSELPDIDEPASDEDDMLCSECKKPIDQLYTHTENGVKRYCSYCYMAQFD